MSAVLEHGAPVALMAQPGAALASQQLITLDPAKYVAEVFRPFRAELALLKAEAEGVTYDIKTTAGMKVAVEHRAKARTLRLGAEQARKDRKAPILEIGKLLDSRANELKAEIEPLELRFDTDIKAEEARKEAEKQAKLAAERARIDAIRARINAVRALPGQALGKSAADIALLAATLSTQEDLTTFDELAGEYCAARADALAQLTKAEAAQRAAEESAEQQRQEAARLAAERAELAKMRAEADERRRAAEAEAQRVANEQAAERKRLEDIAAAQEAALRQQREQAEANLRAAAEAHTREIERARQEQERVAAESKRQMEAQQAAIAAERKALEDAKAEQARAQALAEKLDADHGEALVLDAEYNAERARLQAASEQLLADARTNAAAKVDDLLASTSLTDRADQLLVDELWPDNAEIASEIIPAIREIFMREWGMDQEQADARMSRFDFAAALAEMAVAA